MGSRARRIFLPVMEEIEQKWGLVKFLPYLEFIDDYIDRVAQLEEQNLDFLEGLLSKRKNENFNFIAGLCQPFIEEKDFSKIAATTTQLVQTEILYNCPGAQIHR